MECLLEANPVPDIIWYQGAKVILDSSRIKMSKKATGKDTYLLKLEISNPTKQDGGNYRCNACNTHGESNANISLNFQGMLSFGNVKVFPLVVFSFCTLPIIMLANIHSSVPFLSFYKKFPVNCIILISR